MRQAAAAVSSSRGTAALGRTDRLRFARHVVNEAVALKPANVHLAIGERKRAVPVFHVAHPLARVLGPICVPARAEHRMAKPTASVSEHSVLWAAGKRGGGGGSHEEAES